MSDAISEPILHPLPALQVLAEYLEVQARSGKSRVFMRPEAREALREICRMKPGRAHRAAPASKPHASPVSSTPPATEQGAVVSLDAKSGSVVVTRSVLAPVRSVSVPTLPQTPPLSREERMAALDALAKRAADSPAAKALGTLRERMVFSTGDPEAGLMLVGEAPGAQEEQMGEPFVGPAGQLLDRILKAMGLERSAVYISNVCKFRPSTSADQGTKNRKPTLPEMLSCLEYVHEELAIVRPRAIVALGATAAEGLLQRPVTVGSLRGRWLDCRGVPLMVTYHPSYLLHREADGPVAAQAEKRKCWEDMLKVMEQMGLPVSAKHQAYFLPKS